MQKDAQTKNNSPKKSFEPVFHRGKKNYYALKVQTYIKKYLHVIKIIKKYNISLWAKINKHGNKKDKKNSKTSSQER